MQKTIQNADLGKLTHLSQLTKIKDQIFAIKNSVNNAANIYQHELISLDKNHKAQLWSHALNVSSPMQIGDYLVFLRGGDLYKMPLNGGTSEIILEDENVTTLIDGKNGRDVYVKTEYTAVPPKFDNTIRPDTRRVTKFDNRADGTGWIDDNNKYAILRLDVLTGKIADRRELKYNLDLVDARADNNDLLVLRGRYPELQTASDETKAAYIWHLANRTDDDQITDISHDVLKGQFSDAKFSPDYAHVYLIGNDASHPNCTLNDLYEYDIDKQRLIDLTHDLEIEVGGSISTDFIQNHGSSMRWLANGSLLFTAAFHGHSQLWLYNGRKLHCIWEDHQFLMDFIPLNDQEIMLNLSSTQCANQLVIFNYETQESKVFYNPNEEFDKAHTYAQVSDFVTTSKDNKFSIHGWVLKHHSAKKLPVILYVHGGPQAAYGDVYFHEFQALASRGYAIVYVNPRGSTTYRQDFEAAGIGRMGKEDYEDVMQGLDAALDEFDDLDASNLFIAGGSYGGFMTSWVIGHTDRFNAACVQRPVSDWHALYGTSDIGVRFCRKELGMDLFDEGGMQFYWNCSPLKYAKQVVTPTRIQHGEWDMRCPVNQSEALFTAIKQTGTDVDYIRYPQSFHGFSRNGKPNLRYTRTQDIYEWFDKYKK